MKKTIFTTDNVEILNFLEFSVKNAENEIISNNRNISKAKKQIRDSRRKIKVMDIWTQIRPILQSVFMIAAITIGVIYGVINTSRAAFINGGSLRNTIYILLGAMFWAAIVGLIAWCFKDIIFLEDTSEITTKIQDEVKSNENLVYFLNQQNKKLYESAAEDDLSLTPFP